ncbi:MAG: DegT/DnrJ/EryC1/StrS family aminotransferase, partial [Alphaproteobacteria bacterium]|nr:DegT/DnrJ/EryC1/StrS family aminotransferase [Alphaproteobacteria bacterium]
MNDAKKLALLGGTPVTEEPFHFNNGIGEDEKTAVMRVLDSGELSGFIASPDDYFWGGPEVRGLEKAFCDHFGC